LKVERGLRISSEARRKARIKKKHLPLNP